MAGDPYVVCDGSGDSFSTPDANLLDADTAHCYQSVGEWIPNGASPTLTEAVTAFTGAPFDYAMRISADTVQATSIRTSSGTSGIPVSGSTQYTIAVTLYPEDAADSWRFWCEGYDSGGGSLGVQGSASYVSCPLTTATVVSFTFTTDPTCAYIRINLNQQNVAAVNDSVLASGFILQTGTATTFVPSIRIVGNVDQRAKVAFNAAPSSTSYIGGIWGGSASRQAFRLIGVSGGQVRADVKVAGPVQNSVAATATTPTSATVWRHTFDVSSGAHVLYEDGAAVDSDTDTTGAVEVVTDHGVLEVGAGGSNTPGSANLFDGTILYYELRDGIDGPIVRRMDPGDIYG